MNPHITIEPATPPSFPHITLVPYRPKKYLGRCISCSSGVGDDKNQIVNKVDSTFLEFANRLSQPSKEAIEIKTKTHTFNHTHDFCLSERVIWCRLRNHTEDKWNPVYFTHYKDQNTPESIFCDGANLVVVDESRTVYYKKILREFRNTEINQTNRYRFPANLDIENSSYIAMDKSERNNWKNKWFSLPYLNLVLNLITGKRLQLSPTAKAWAVSHRGVYNNYLEDRLRRPHPVDGGTTTFYELESNGKDIIEHDPWSPQLAKISIPLPETSQSIFKAENISVSASTLMVIGYEMKKGEMHQQLKIQTFLADIDSLGWNPIQFPYDYFYNEDQKVWVLPLPSWQTHDVTIPENSFITKQITIIQTGEGNNNRELRIIGTKHGQSGYYCKNINENEWDFVVCETLGVVTEEESLPLMKITDQPFISSVHDYESIRSSLRFVEPSLTIRLYNFGQRALQSTLELIIDDKTYLLDIYKKKTLKNFFGIPGDSYHLVIPEPLHQNDRLSGLFGEKKVIPVSFKEEEDRLTLQSVDSSFTCIFRKV